MDRVQGKMIVTGSVAIAVTIPLGVNSITYHQHKTALKLELIRQYID